MGGLMLITGIVLSLTGLLYAGLIGLFTFGWYRQKGPTIAGTLESSMKVSVIVAARNEEECMTDLLNDLAAQHYPSSLMEILIIDDHSIDNTIEIIRNNIDGQNFHGFKLINNEDCVGKKAAIAAGISKATGDLILLTDADCRLGPGWVSAMVSYFEDKTKMMMELGKNPR